MGACVCFNINLCRISDSFDGVLERLALQFSLLFSVTQLYGRKSQPPVNFLNSALMFGPDVGLLLLILHQASETVIFFARSFAIDPLLPQLKLGKMLHVFPGNVS